MGIPLRCWCNLAVLFAASLGATWGQTALNFIPVTPCRVVDTRYGTAGFTGPISAGATVSFNPVGSCGVPSTAQA